MSVDNFFSKGNSDSLENFLINCGLKYSELDRLKRENNLSVSELFRYYTEMIKEDLTLVPVGKIVGIGSGRGTINESWFENLLNYDKHNFRESTISELLGKMELSLGGFKDSFQQEIYSGDNLVFAYLEEDDIYVSGSGGSHRTLFSKICGAEYILARVRIFRVDKHKYHNYKRFHEKFKDLQKIVNDMSLDLTNDEKSFYITYQGENIICCNFNLPFDYSSDQKVDSIIDKILENQNYINRIREEYEILIIYPKFIRKIVLNVKLNNSNEWKLKHLKSLLEFGWEL